MDFYRKELSEKGWTELQIETAIDYYLACSESREYDCMDNVRFAREDNNEERMQYLAQRDGGCCGFHDEVFPCPDGPVMVGFNYGH